MVAEFDTMRRESQKIKMGAQIQQGPRVQGIDAIALADEEAGAVLVQDFTVLRGVF